ncbi:hypothetical protein PR048_020655 [Dryococelus australis]|uniref:Uncharacterized protein n=1 Tax=Dryococelus australis TaxID=614101 RepID=A0ABQ9H6Z0_9NEOP|nr:hypothetical protein PR048_020655 [Dryococelus australis]
MSKHEYGKWRAEDMAQATDEYKEGKLRLNECARQYNVPKCKLIIHVSSEVKRGIGLCERTQPVNGRQTDLPPDVEKELEDILKLEDHMFDLS